MYQSCLSLLPGIFLAVRAVGSLTGGLWIAGYLLYGVDVLLLHYNYLVKKV